MPKNCVKLDVISGKYVNFFSNAISPFSLGGNTFIKSANLETSTKWKMSVFEQKPSFFFSSQKAIKTEM